MTVALDVLDEPRCWELLAANHFGRIGVSVEALPVIFPVNYGVWDGAIVFRTAPGTKLTAATYHAVVSFEIDHFDEAGRSGWSVMAQGLAKELQGTERERVLALPMKAWADTGWEHVVAIVPQTLSGRRLGHSVL